MFPPKTLLDAIGSQASRLFNGATPLPNAEIEARFKAILQGALSKLDVVSRDEFDCQMLVLARTRARLATALNTQRGVRAWDLAPAAVWVPHDVYQRAVIRVDGRVVQKGTAGIASLVVVLSNATNTPRSG